MKQALKFFQKTNQIALVYMLTPPDDPEDCLNLFTNNDLMHSYWRKQIYSDLLGRDEEFDSTSGGTHIRGSHNDMVKLNSKLVPFLRRVYENRIRTMHYS